MNNRLKLIELNNKQSKPRNRFTIKRFINRSCLTFNFFNKDGYNT